MRNHEFKYSPNAYNIDVINTKPNVCQCCNENTEEYIETMYTQENLSCICLSCVSNGKAAEKFDGTFISDAEKYLDEEKTKELFERTVPYISFQGEYWLTCCEDYCAFIDYVGTKELEDYGLREQLITEHENKSGMKGLKNYLVKNGDCTGYLFKCLHCGQYHLHVDMS